MGDNEVTTSVVDVKVFYTITPEISSLIIGSPEAKMVTAPPKLVPNT
jgi:hypothetical protein